MIVIRETRFLRSCDRHSIMRSVPGTGLRVMSPIVL